ncbi:hypothetical protein Fsol_00152 [Candidatus Fokinia solitaria]|uniref:Uncharacterized protein n=1 Tax=Candidatus Fokinia solitaria TaxID=1802984 RepID=A0A2U8BRJ8_9RICK|nr:C45 family autoproteolytic acyltransferase/hydolase [Candidatus Fokinia solitaria]AWD32959.1 hypothetical protein Fsol_00152 [Candidatus Fokinia solitaria]
MSIKRITLKGTKYEMGFQYGAVLQAELKTSLGIIKEFFIGKHHFSNDALLNKTNAFYERYPSSFQDFIKGVANGADLTLGDAKILNGMETLNSLIANRSEISACAFVAIPPFKTGDSVIIGRNYDFPAPFSKLAKYLLITILLEENAIPTAFIGMPGQIYCSTCINQNSLFVEFNNATPSGGKAVNQERESLLISLLSTLQSSRNLLELDSKLQQLESDYSLVVNVADKKYVRAYEYSSYYGMKSFTPEENSVYASTNFYLNKTWNRSVISDENTWYGVTRMNNLLNLAKTAVSVSDVMNMLDRKLSDGGATWNLTIYQIIYDAGAYNLHIKRTLEDEEWECIDMHELFADVPLHTQEL